MGLGFATSPDAIHLFCGPGASGGKIWDGGGGFLIWFHEPTENVDHKRISLTTYFVIRYSICYSGLLPNGKSKNLFHKNLAIGISVASMR